MARPIRSLAGLAILAGLLAAGQGCGESYEPLEVHPVKGVVHYKGQPMKGGGSILFFPLKAGGKEASGTIAEDGTFTLRTYTEGDGAAAGNYRVVIYQVTTQEPETSPEAETTAEAVDTVAAKDRIPEIYSNSTSSPLNQEIKAGENDLKIELQSNVNRGA